MSALQARRGGGDDEAGSTDSYDSDSLRRDLPDFDPALDVLWDDGDATGVSRHLQGVWGGLGPGPRKQRRAPADKAGEKKKKKKKATLARTNSRPQLPLSNGSFKGKGKAAAAAALEDGEDKESDGENVGGGEDEEEEDPEQAALAKVLARRFERFGPPGVKSLVRGEDGYDTDGSGGGFDGDDEFDEVEGPGGRPCHARHDPLRDMPRMETMLRLTDTGGVLPVELECDDLGRIIVKGCRGAALQAGVQPGYHLVRVGQDAVWPPSKRRVSRKFVLGHMLAARPLELTFEKCYPVKRHRVRFTMQDEPMGFSLEQHKDSKLIYVDKVSTELMCPARRYGLLGLDILVDMNGVDADEVEKWGLASVKFKQALEARPLTMTVARGVPLHTALLPARREANPEKEARMSARIAKQRAEARRRGVASESTSRRPTALALAAGGSEFMEGAARRGSKHSNAGRSVDGGSEAGSNAGALYPDAAANKGWSALRTSVLMGAASSPPPAASAVSAVAAKRRGSLMGLMAGHAAGGARDAQRQRSQEGGGGPAQVEVLEMSVTTASLGAGVKDATGGVVVVSVVAGSEAERLGMKVGDLITACGAKQFPIGQRLPRSHFLRSFVREARPCLLLVERISNNVKHGKLAEARRNLRRGGEEDDADALSMAQTMIGGGGRAVGGGGRDARLSLEEAATFSFETREVVVEHPVKHKLNAGKDLDQVACGGAILER